jgi:tetratricopeptide (TPR) repeat protein
MICSSPIGNSSRTAHDARGIPVSCSNAAALDLFEEALGQYHGYVGDPLATIDQALELAPDFVLGHLFKAIVLMTFSERRFAESARESLVSAQALLASTNSRERTLAAAASRLVDGDWDGACDAFDAVLVEHPRDAFAIQSAHLMDFYRGDSLNLRNRILRVLPHWTPGVPGYPFVLGMQAFGLEECNQYPEAEQAGRRAVELQPKDVWAIHAVTHVLEMQGRIEEGIGWLERRTSDWAPGNGFAYHNWWHLALFYLDGKAYERATALYDKEIHGTRPDFALQLVDATSLLWRLRLDGADIGSRAEAVADNWALRLDNERGFYAFNDAHAMMAFVLAGRRREAARILADLEWTVMNGQGVNVMMAREVGLPVCRALEAFGEEKYGEAVRLLLPVRDIACKFGGSHAQRDVLTLTLIEAAIRDNQHKLARHYIAERTVTRPDGKWGQRLMRRATV